MYNLDARKHVLTILSPIIGAQQNVRSSALLQCFSVINEMCKTQITQPDVSYRKVTNDFSAYINGMYRIIPYISVDVFKNIAEGLADFSYVEFLTYVVPDLVCDSQRTVDYLQKIKPGMSYIEQTHHIIKIKLLAYKMDAFTTKQARSAIGYDDILDKLYEAYISLDNTASLGKEAFLRLYSSINTFALSPDALSPNSRGAGFKDKDLEDLMGLLTDKLQLTRPQQLDLVARCFVDGNQATDIIPTIQTYNFTSYKDVTERKKYVRQAHRLMVKIPPLELICAISSRKKNGTVSSKKGTEALTVPNDVMLETGFVYPMFKNLIGRKTEDAILLVYPSAFFVRNLLADESLHERNISIVLQDKNAAALLKYQIEDSTYATRFNRNNLIPVSTLMKQVEEKRLPYKKVFLFGNHLPFDQQQDQIVSILKAATDYSDVFALISTYAIEDAVPLGREITQLKPYLKTISLIPQGINNSSFPRRKIWVHFNSSAVLKNDAVQVYAYTLDTSTKTQSISLLKEDPLEMPRGRILQLDQSIRKCYSREILFRRAQGRTRTMAFSHEITPDIPVWCSRTFPNGVEENPRLEAYVCMPPSEEKILRGFSARGEIIQSTKKHTTQVPQSEVLNWLESIYPLSYVQQRYTAEEKKQQGVNSQLKPEISIREEIIEKYTPLLEKQNIALKTLWYLYPNLSNKYTGSDYQVLTQMMQTVIGQQRVCDITSELAEKLLLEVYPNLSEAALWRNYKILSIAMERAVQHRYCPYNPLEDALRQEKLRRKLFAQVRKQLVKKHLTEPEFKQTYHTIISKIQNGQYEYLGVLIRLLTGLESNIVCALRWCDMIQASSIDVVYFVITRQLSNDGKDSSGFSDIEDYICFPLSAGLRSTLESFRGRLHEVADETRIMDSVIGLASNESTKLFTPTRLNELTKGILKEFNVEENYFNIAYSNDEFRKINLNKYMGDFIRENFRYWATMAAELLPAELSFLLRNRVDSTCGRYYCDFQNEASLAILATKLSRMECLFMQGDPPMAQRETKSNVYQFTRQVQPKNGYRQKVSVEIWGESSVEVYTHSPRGIRSSVTNLSIKEEKST